MRAFLLAVIAAASLDLACTRRASAPGAGVAVPGEPAAPDLVTLTVVGTNDLHGHIESLPWLSGHLDVLRRARARAGGAVLLVDAGDMFQGTLESNLGEGAAVVRAYNVLGYAAAAIGNHEFDFGPVGPATAPRSFEEDPRGALKARAREAAFPFLAANLHEKGGELPLPWANVKPTVLVEAAGVKVGIVGVITRAALGSTLPANVRGLMVAHPAAAIRREAAALRAAGAAVVVVAAHEGGSCRAFDAPDDAAACDPDGPIFAVARALPAGLVDVIVAGHEHAGIAHRVAGVAIIESYSGGRAFGRVDLVVDRRRGRVESARLFPPRWLCGPSAAGCEPGLYEGVRVAADPHLARLLAPDFARARDRREHRLGVTIARPVRRAHKQESPLGNLFADLMRAARPQADLAITNGGGLRADLPAGPLTYGALHEAFPFDNAFARLRMTAGALGEVIARHLQQPSGGIISISGVRVVASCAEAGLVVELRREGGGPIAGDETLTLVTSDYLATGGDGLLEGHEADLEGGLGVRDTMAAMLAARGGVLRGDDMALLDPGNPRISAPGPRPVRCPSARPGAR